jgi:hypothetical protein
MSTARRRSLELAHDVARRAIEAAERRQAEAGLPDDLAERLRGVADEDGRVTVDQAIEAVTGADGPPNPLAAEYRARQEAKNKGVFPEPEHVDPPTRPQGSADGGEGEPENAVYETTLDGQRMRVFTDDELRPDNPKEDT